MKLWYMDRKVACDRALERWHRAEARYNAAAVATGCGAVLLPTLNAMRNAADEAYGDYEEASDCEFTEADVAAREIALACHRRGVAACPHRLREFILEGALEAPPERGRRAS